MKVCFVGGGAMGTAILAAGLQEGVLQKDDVTVCEVVAARREAIASEFGVHVAATPAEGAAGADAVILAVKPQDLGSVGKIPGTGVLVISIMAGVTMDTIRSSTGATRLVRVMPNTPATIRAGMSAWTASNDVTDEDRTFVAGLLSALGEELYVADESKIDVATAVNGSGPAFVFLLMEAMVDGAVAEGLTRPQAEQLVAQTFYGSALYAKESNASLADLKAQVTSPGGTTAAGLQALEQHAVRAAMSNAVAAAHRRARELGGKA